MTDHNLIEAVRRLRKRHEQQPAISPASRQERDDLLALLAGIEDLFDRTALLEKADGTLLRAIDALCDRVARIESAQRRINERLEFLGHLSRMLGHEDWTVDDPPDPGSLATAVPACVPGTSGAGELVPPELAGIRQPSI